METRPRINIQLTKTDKVLELLCVALLVVLWLGTVSGYSTLPDQIPTHFNAGGKADNFGGKAKIFTLPVIATVIYFVITLLNRHPHVYNYPVPVTTDNAERLYRSVTRLMRVLKLIVIFIFALIVGLTFRSALSDGTGLRRFFLPAVVFMIFVPIILSWINAIRKKPAKHSGLANLNKK